jgi:hypothetical protein
LLLLLPVAQGQIYHWIDQDGRTHYGDRPPDDLPVRELDPELQSLTTIGGSELRESERELLRSAEQAAREERQAQQAAAQSRPPPVNIVTVERERERPAIYWPNYLPYRPYYRDRYYRQYSGLRADLSFGDNPRVWLRYGDQNPYYDRSYYDPPYYYPDRNYWDRDYRDHSFRDRDRRDYRDRSVRDRRHSFREHKRKPPKVDAMGPAPYRRP